MILVEKRAAWTVDVKCTECGHTNWAKVPDSAVPGQVFGMSCYECEAEMVGKIPLRPVPTLTMKP